MACYANQSGVSSLLDIIEQICKERTVSTRTHVCSNVYLKYSLSALLTILMFPQDDVEDVLGRPNLCLTAAGYVDLNKGTGTTVHITVPA